LSALGDAIVPTGKICLVGVSEAVKGLRWESTKVLRIGRQQDMDIVVSDPSIARVHAEIHMTSRGWMVQDRDGASRTLINGIPAGTSGRLFQKDDVLQCGTVVFRVSELEIERPKTPAPLPAPSNIKTTGAMLRIEALSQRTWEQGLRENPQDEGFSAPAQHLLTLLRAGYHFGRLDSLAELLQSLLDDTVAVLDARRGAILLADESSRSLTLHSVAGLKVMDNAHGFSETLANRCFSKGESVLCRDATLPASTSVVHSGMTSIICALLRSPQGRLGVMHFDRGPMQAPFSEADFRLADAIAATVSVGIESAMAVEKQKQRFVQEAVDLAQGALSMRDSTAAARGQRESYYAGLLAEELHLSAADRRLLQIGAALHDLGKLGMEDAPRKQPGDRTAEETAPRRAHVEKGVALAQTISGLTKVIPIIRHHHEHWDGSGYPDGLKGDAIPRLARLTAIVARLDELLTGADNLPGMPVDQAIRELQGRSGREFDPAGVTALVRVQAKLPFDPSLADPLIR
jgi:HD-GYP domain-containing protein (c-di-GMP phosphodiesterase class II)